VPHPAARSAADRHKGDFPTVAGFGLFEGRPPFGDQQHGDKCVRPAFRRATLSPRSLGVINRIALVPRSNVLVGLRSHRFLTIEIPSRVRNGL
jgi:hypothetical protein